MVDREAGVSPVVGVMLLLVIVVILAALVAAFAGGAVDVKEAAPSVDLAVYTAGGDENFRLIFEHRGGDLLSVDDLKVNTWVHLAGGDLQPASHEGYGLRPLFNGTDPGSPGKPVIWRAGEIGNTTNLTATAEFLGVEADELSDNITQSATVDVAVYHLPSGALLHKSSLLLKER